MRKKLLISAVGVIGIFGLSAAAFSQSLNGIHMDADEAETLNIMLGSYEESISTKVGKALIEKNYDRKIANFRCGSDDAYLLAKIAMAEAEDQDVKGKALVILVVLNRVLDSDFPDTIREVLYEEKQFSPVSNGRFESVEPDRDCWRALDMVQEEHWDESYGALYFESKSESTWHEDNLKFLFKYGEHYFYTDKEKEY